MEDLFSPENRKLIFDIVYWALFLPFGLGLLRFRRLTGEQKLILAIVTLTLVSDSLTIYLQKQSIRNLWVYHIFVPALFYFMVSLYRERLKNSFSKKVYRIFIGSFLVVSLINSLFIQTISSFNSNAIVLASLIYILFSIYFFFNLLKQPSVSSLESDPMFWFNTGVLLYHSSTLMLFIFVNNLIEAPDANINVTLGLNAVFNFFLILFYLVSLWVRPRQ